jgi:hypothetical protein
MTSVLTVGNGFNARRKPFLTLVGRRGAIGRASQMLLSGPLRAEGPIAAAFTLRQAFFHVSMQHERPAI